MEAGKSVIDVVLEVFTSIGSWIVTAVNNMIPMFYAPTTGLTFLGVLALAGLGISVTFLLVRVIQNFLHFRG